MRIERIKKILWMAMALAILTGPVSTWLGARAAAQDDNTLVGTVYDVNGKPYPGVVLVFTSTENGKTFSVTADGHGHYNTPGFAAGMWNIDVKDKGQIVFGTAAKVGGGQENTLDIKIIVSDAQKKAAAAQAAQAAAFQNLKVNFDAGVVAATQAETLHAQLATAPADQRDTLQSQIADACETAIKSFQLALQGMGDTDTNRPIVLARIAAAYDLEGKADQSVSYYQQAVALKPDDAGYYNNLGNSLAETGKIDDAMAAYQKSADLDPANAAAAWRNAGAILYNTGKMTDAVVPFQKSLTFDPKNAQTWFLLGQCLMNTMGQKQEGDKIIPIIQPGTVEAFQKAVQLDPNGQWGTQAQQDLDALQAMGLGIDTKVSNNKKGKS
jgi:tetratricopeptide (TPR) repeat protein